MTKVNYGTLPLTVSSSPSFTEASKEELRVLLALLECQGVCQSESELAEMTKVSVARCVSALALWEEAGVIKKNADNREDAIITEEFEERLHPKEIDERPAKEVAVNIRDENLSSLFDECAALMGTSALQSGDVKNLAALNTQYALSPEFILTLAAHMASKGKLTVRRLVNEAIRLSDKGCDNVEALEKYIENKEADASVDWEFRRIFGIYGRNLSQSEKTYFKKWSDEYGYSTAIVSEAYDIAVLNTSKGDMRYIDKILAGWHENGLTTVAQCRAHAENSTPKADSAEKRKRPKSEPEKPRYGDFDINDAFKRALERSYGDDSEQ